MDEDENNTDFAAARFLGAILTKERKMFHISGIKEQEKRTKNWASVSTMGKRTFRETTPSKFSKSEVRSYSNWSLNRMKTFKESKHENL